MGFVRRTLREIGRRKLFAGDIIRILGFPVQRLLDRPGNTHRFLTLKGVEILDADGFSALASWYRSHLEEIMRGNAWADRTWKNSCHHYDPRVKRGLFLWPSAVDQARSWFRNAVQAWATGDITRSVFFVGACLHLIQDMCQPYHSNRIILDGHQAYERWVDRNKEIYAEESGGIYNLGSSVEEWVKKNAEFSKEFLSLVLPSAYGNGYHSPTAVLLSRAQRTSAGFLVFFMEKAKETAYEPVPGFFEEVLQWKSPSLRFATSSHREENHSGPTTS
ncbi:MAG: zinc dependent phospholipase C family protein [Firmicutes bacterium]|nr:zinc dependent phospholipase C family protein [Candidatus Fermentithermobacillaceae bacterium]